MSVRTTLEPTRYAVAHALRTRAMRTAVLFATLARASAGAAGLATLLVSQPAEAQAGKGRDDHAEEMALAIGETKTLPAKDVKNFSEGVPGVVDVRLTSDSSQFIIAGKKAGTTTLLLIKNDGSQITWNITVSVKSLAAVERELQQLTEGMSGVRVRRVGGRFFLEGGVTTEAELKRVQQVAQLFPGQVESLVTVGSGTADRKLLVRLDFFFVQYDRTASYAVGLGWPDSLGGVANNQPTVQNNFSYDFISGTATSAQASVVNHPLPRLDIAQRHGWAKVTKQSTVITSNGSEATFNSGAEQNFISTNGLQATLIKIPSGTNVTVLPRFDSTSREIEIKLEAEVADLIPALSGTVPGRSVTKLQTFVNLKLGQALILSGIRSRTQRHAVGGLPGLSYLPVIGLLFASHSDDQLENEGAVFIIPSIVETVPKSAIEVIKNALSSYEDYAGNIESVDSFNKTPPSAK